MKPRIVKRRKRSERFILRRLRDKTKNLGTYLDAQIRMDKISLREARHGKKMADRKVDEVQAVKTVLLKEMKDTPQRRAILRWMGRDLMFARADVRDSVYEIRDSEHRLDIFERLLKALHLGSPTPKR